MRNDKERIADIGAGPAMSEGRELERKERPILMSAPMVRALLAGTKTQTRRIVSHEWDHGAQIRRRFTQATGRDDFVTFSEPYTSLMKEPIWFYSWGNTRWLRSHYGRRGDQLWVQEMWRQGNTRVLYRVDDVAPSQLRWKSAIYMRRCDSRITLEITDVRVERLQEISGPDCLAEGIKQETRIDDGVPKQGDIWKQAKDRYRDLWESINGPGSWALNPWVWVVCFRRLTP